MFVYFYSYGLWYILLISLTWLLYFTTIGILNSLDYWLLRCVILTTVVVAISAVLMLTYRDIFIIHMLPLSATVALALCFLSLAFLVIIPLRLGTNDASTVTDISPIGHFAFCIEILLLIYTVFPLRLYMCITIGVFYSILFELLTWILHVEEYAVAMVMVRILLHLCIHLIGLHILVMTNVRMRNTFMKVGQSLLVGQQLKSEKNLKENMLHSLMPPKVSK